MALEAFLIGLRLGMGSHLILNPKRLFLKEFVQEFDSFG